MRRLVLPVIHYISRRIAFEQTLLAFKYGADGVWLLSHQGDDETLMSVAAAIKQAVPSRKIGVNLLTESASAAFVKARSAHLDMLWTDRPGVSSMGVVQEGERLRALMRETPELACFGSVAFKYQPNEPDPPAAAVNAQDVGFLPTTSGPRTGIAPPFEKIRAMREALGPGRPLAIAGGMTVDNVATFAGLASHFLVSTGVSQAPRQPNLFDEAKLMAFVRKVHAFNETVAVNEVHETAAVNG